MYADDTTFYSKCGQASDLWQQLRSIPAKKPSFQMQELTFSSKLDWGSHIFSIAKSASKNIGALIRFMKFFSPGLLCISVNLLYNRVWNIFVTPGLVLIVATWNG